MDFKKSLGSLKSGADAFRQKNDIRRTIEALRKAIVLRKRQFEQLEKETYADKKRCTKLFKENQKRQLLMDREDEIYRAYFREGGIYQILTDLDEVVQYRIDAFESAEHLLAAVYNSRIEMAVFVLERLEKALGESHTVNLSDRGDTDSNESELAAFLEQIGWVDYEPDIKKVIVQLNQAEYMLESMTHADLDVLDRKLRLISSDIDAINLSRNRTLLEKMKKSLESAQASPPRVKYEPLLNQLQRLLRNSDVQALSQIDAHNIQEYKERAICYSNKLHTELLTQWQKE